MKTCDICGKSIPPPVQSGGTGYGISTEWSTFGPDKTVCYACCAIDDRACMIRDGKVSLYLDEDKRMVTNWCDTLSFHVISLWSGHHNMSGKRLDFDFVGPDGYIWHGTNFSPDNQDIARCKRTKRRS